MEENNIEQKNFNGDNIVGHNVMINHCPKELKELLEVIRTKDRYIERLIDLLENALRKQITH